MRYASTQTKIGCPAGLHVSLRGHAPLPDMTEEKGLGFRFALRMHSVLTYRANRMFEIFATHKPISKVWKSKIQYVEIIIGRCR